MRFISGLIVLSLNFCLAQAKQAVGDEANLLIKKISQEFATATQIKCQHDGHAEMALIQPATYSPTTILEHEAFRKARLVYGAINDSLNLYQDSAFYETGSTKLFWSPSQPKINFIADSQDVITLERVKKDLQFYTDSSNQFIQRIQILSSYTAPQRTKIKDEEGVESTFDTISGSFDELQQEFNVFSISGTCELSHISL